MIISSDEDGNITADAHDLEAQADGEHHTLKVSLKEMASAGLEDDFPDFNLERNVPQTPSGLYSDASEKEDEHKFPWLIMGLATLFVVIAIALLWFFFLGGRDSFSLPMAQERAAPIPPPVIQQSQDAPQPQVQPPPAPAVQPQVQLPSQPPAEPPVIQAPAAPPPPRPVETVRTRPPAPVMSYRVPAVIPRNGVVYQIRWGDTLWDISEAFYRNPWLYPRIARHNNIRNPDHIIAGSNIRIPPRD
jgi:outer membrane biosynthesis protein TonB